MMPLNVYLESATPEQLEHAVREYGDAIRELAIANVFPGDMLWRNFGVNRHGRVVFYDYDEIEYLTDCVFRAIPPAPNPEAELAEEVWYPVGPLDVFPEEFESFLLGEPRVRGVFLEHHAELLEPELLARLPAVGGPGRGRRLLPLPGVGPLLRAVCGRRAARTARGPALVRPEPGLGCFVGAGPRPALRCPVGFPDERRALPAAVLSDVRRGQGVPWRA